ncbi:MAG: hypothetical protein JNK49_11435 [Planctomycetes bacterium]|nr:hypothetical protein [Planctomycetota bacterium]
MPRDLPFLGKTLEVNLFHLPNDAALVAFGWQRMPPLALGAYGMPGCTWQIQADASVFVAGTQNTATYRLPIPSMAGLIGLRFYNQAAVLDVGANPMGAVVSGACEGVVGGW